MAPEAPQRRHGLREAFDALCCARRPAAGRDADPTAALFDARTLQSSPESGGRAGYGGHKRSKCPELRPDGPLPPARPRLRTPAGTRRRPAPGRLLLPQAPPRHPRRHRTCLTRSKETVEVGIYPPSRSATIRRRMSRWARAINTAERIVSTPNAATIALTNRIYPPCQGQNLPGNRRCWSCGA